MNKNKNNIEFPLGLLFGIGIEILGCAMRRSTSIKRFEIEPVNLAQYAGDTSIIDRDAQSIYNLFDLLAVFKKCSGLKINQSKSELLWLASKRFCKDNILNLTLSDELILALGV